MMTGLFFSFENSSLFSFSQFSMISIFLLPLLSIFYMKNRYYMFLYKIVFFLKSELKPLFGQNYQNGSILCFLSMMFIILLNNLQGLMSYTFTWTSHLLFSFSYGFTFWFSILMMGLLNNFIKNMSHLVPMGTPLILMSFMVMIETLSILIRPITLSVRLAANITAGHLLLSLISWSDSLLVFNIIAQLLMFFLEIMVSVIQSYVYTMLLILYMEEEN